MKEPVKFFLDTVDIMRDAVSCDGMRIPFRDAIAVADEILTLRRQGEPARCNDCLMPYGEHDWIDTVLPDRQWKIIAPDGGILCANCIIKRASKLNGIVGAEMKLIFSSDIAEVEK